MRLNLGSTINPNKPKGKWHTYKEITLASVLFFFAPTNLSFGLSQNILACSPIKNKHECLFQNGALLSPFCGKYKKH